MGFWKAFADDHVIGFLRENPRSLERVSIYVSLSSAGFLLASTDTNTEELLQQFHYVSTIIPLWVCGTIFLVLALIHILSFFISRRMRRLVVGVKMLWAVMIATSVFLSAPFGGTDILYLGYCLSCSFAFIQIKFGRRMD